MFKKKKKIKPRDIFSGSFLAQGLGFTRATCTREQEMDSAPKGARRGTVTCRKVSSAPFAEVPAANSEGLPDPRELPTAAGNSPASVGGSGGGGWGQEGRKMKRNHTLNFAVC